MWCSRRAMVVLALVIALVGAGCAPTAASPGLSGVSIAPEAGWSDAARGPDEVAVRRDIDGGTVVVRLATVDVESAAAAARAVRGAADVVLLAESGSRMSGQTGANLELENPTDTTVTLLGAQSGPLRLDAGERMWLSLFDTADGVLAITVTAPASAWEAALLTAEPLLESVRIGE